MSSLKRRMYSKNYQALNNIGNSYKFLKQLVVPVEKITKIRKICNIVPQLQFYQPHN